MLAPRVDQEWSALLAAEQPSSATRGGDGDGVEAADGASADVGGNVGDVEEGMDTTPPFQVQASLLEKMKERMVPLLAAQASSLQMPVAVKAPIAALVSAAVDAFGEMDLLTATRALMQGAKCSFGLLIRCPA